MGPGQRRAALLLLAVVSVNASYTVLIPFVPDLENRVGAGPAVIALTFALFAAAKALFQPVGGLWVDKWRPGSVACVSLLVAAAGIVITALAKDSTTLLVGRFCWGAGEGLVTPALYSGMTLLCRHYGISTSRMMGNFGSAAIGGFLLGPLIAGVAAPVGLEALFLAGAAVTALTAFGLLPAIPESGSAVPAEPEPSAPSATGSNGLAAGRWWVWVLVFGAMDLFTNLINTALEPALPLYLSEHQGTAARGTISLVFVIGLAAFGLSTWALGRWTERLRLVPLIQIGLVVSALGLTGLAASAGVVPVTAGFILVMVGYAVLYLTARRGIVELRSAMTGRAFGLFGLIGDIGSVLGPIAGVALYEWTGRLSFVLLGTLCAIVLAFLIATTGRDRDPLSRPAAVPVQPTSAAP
jgi:MFS family permease